MYLFQCCSWQRKRLILVFYSVSKRCCSFVVKILLRNRATDLEARMDDGTTPLILAARHDLPDLVRYLIKAGVKVNSADNQGVCLTCVFPLSRRLRISAFATVSNTVDLCLDRKIRAALGCLSEQLGSDQRTTAEWRQEGCSR